jgi:predicted nucleic acid-binding protein
LERYIDQFLVQPSTMAMAHHWAEIVSDGRRRGRPISTSDAWVAATARFLGVPLVTHNQKDFAGVPQLELISLAL